MGIGMVDVVDGEDLEVKVGDVVKEKKGMMEEV